MPSSQASLSARKGYLYRKDGIFESLSSQIFPSNLFSSFLPEGHGFKHVSFYPDNRSFICKDKTVLVFYLFWTINMVY